MKKTMLIEVSLPTANIPSVQPVLEQCLRETRDTLIGHGVYEDLALFVVRLRSNETSSDHLNVLAPAFGQGLITSFQFVSCYLFKVVFQSKDDVQAIRRFPLREGEAWFLSADEANAIYLSLRSSYLSAGQVAWEAQEQGRADWRDELENR